MADLQVQLRDRWKADSSDRSLWRRGLLWCRGLLGRNPFSRVSQGRWDLEVTRRKGQRVPSRESKMDGRKMRSRRRQRLEHLALGRKYMLIDTGGCSDLAQEYSR